MTPSALTLRAGHARAVVEPDHGARITSIVLGGCEWLQQPVGPLHPAQPFDDFVRPDIGGWDEMVPTCVPARYNGADLPDHGEVWSRAWVVDSVSETAATAHIECRTVPLLVERRTTLAADHLSLRYRLVNVGEGPVPVFWMAHPLFDAAELVAVTVSPPGVAIECTVSSRGNGRVGPAGVAPLLPAALEPGGYRKYRLGDAGDVTSVTLVRADGPRLTVGWSADVPVHVQWWVDNAGIGPAPVVAPEPATAGGDDPVTARDRDQLPTLEPGEALQVTVDVVGSRAS